jgi:hypothetical protein
MRKWACAALIATMACSQNSVQWAEPRSDPADTTGVMTLGADATPAYPSVRRYRMPADSSMCPHSVASAMNGDRQYSAWLRLRPDATVNVVAAEWDGRQWSTPAIVDSLDVGHFGCSRPAPSIAVSEADGYVHVAYSLKAPEGYGVFFAHSMDRGRSFHSPMIVVYGDRLSATSIAAHGVRVGIAYEVPSGSAKRVDVALSSTQGHTFDPRERASPDEMPATHPRIAIRDTVVALSFAGIDSTQRALRLGYIRR